MMWCLVQNYFLTFNASRRRGSVMEADFYILFLLRASLQKLLRTILRVNEELLAQRFRIFELIDLLEQTSVSIVSHNPGNM